MKLMTLAVAVAATMALAQSAQAHTRHHYRRHYGHEARNHLSGPERWAWDDERRWDEPSDDQWMERGGYSDQARRYESGHDRWAWSDDRRWTETGDRPMQHGHYSGGYGPRPSAWCGWEMRQLVGGDPGPSYNLARNWAHWGHAGPAGVGAVVVWPHHVGKIVGRADGEWVIESGNDGHRVRTRPRSIAGVIAIRWG